ncbi:hypothetical protein [Psychroserpens algicola]|uniref:hypothetical protein n=1 Tax=Psychroserpens algicola TaxID=1719034 RepID=UPI001953DAB3|nr:hypothetical protein [Psychroserpens algicola]
MMKFTQHQFTEIAFIFEKSNGNNHSNYEKDIIAKSELTKFNTTEIEELIVNGINSGIYKKEAERVSGYWALSKTRNRKLITEFRKWLLTELNLDNGIAIFQILVALDRLDEQVFHKSRNSRGVDEIELNINDAKYYLNKNSAQQRV